MNKHMKPLFEYGHFAPYQGQLQESFNSSTYSHATKVFIIAEKRSRDIGPIEPV